MVARQSICLRRFGEGTRACEVGFGRWLANGRVTVERLIAGWSERTRSSVAGRHVLAIQDTSEINFVTRPARRRGLGEIGKGSGRGVRVHAMLAVAAETGACLGLAGGSVYTRRGRVTVDHGKRELADKESRRWVETPAAAKPVLAPAAMVTFVGDRESDIYAAWASVPQENCHVLARMMHDRACSGGGTVYGAMADVPFVATRTIALSATPKRAARDAELSMRFGEVEMQRPGTASLRHLPKTVKLRFVEVIERHAPAGVEAVRWRLLTTHGVGNVETAWQIVDWYRQRWTIEQLFRLMKTQGLQIEDSQLATAEGLIKLVAIATKAAAVILQLVQAREGNGGEPAENAFDAPEIAVLDGLNTKLDGKTALQKNPHPRHSLAWASWIIAKLGGWDGYPSSKPPGPITLRHGLEHFKAMAAGWVLRDLCMP